jgi:hypothetical protein
MWLTDQQAGAEHKTTLQGMIVQGVAPPPYAGGERYVPTWIAVNEESRGCNAVSGWLTDMDVIASADTIPQAAFSIRSMARVERGASNVRIAFGSTRENGLPAILLIFEFQKEQFQFRR